MTAALLLVHERWFVSSEGLPTRWGDIAEPSRLLAVGTALAVAWVAWLAWRRFGRPPLLPGPLELGATPEKLALVYGWVPLLLAVHTAVPLIVSGVQNHLFTPNMDMTRGTAALVGLAEVGVGLLLFYGVFARYAGLGLAAIWMLGVFLFGPVLLLEQTIFLGIGAFFWIVGRGPVAIDRVFGAWAGARESLLPWAIPMLRVATGISIIWLAFTEKLLNMPLAERFVSEYPFVNFLPALGLGVGDETFILIAGTIELTFGLLLALGVFPRVVILVLWLPFNLTLTAFGWQELVGHLPIYAVLALVLMWGAGGEEDREAFRAGLVPRGEKPAGPGAPDEEGAREERQGA